MSQARAALEVVGRRCLSVTVHGAVAQLGEHLLCKQGVTGSIPVSSTITAQSRQTESKRSRMPRRTQGRVTGVLLRLFFRSLTIWNDPSIEVEYGFDIRRTVFLNVYPRLLGVIWSSE